jgi:hypothetical protein
MMNQKRKKEAHLKKMMQTPTALRRSKYSLLRSMKKSHAACARRPFAQSLYLNLSNSK